MKITVLRTGRGSALTVLKHDSDGKLVFSDDFSATKQRDHRRIASSLGVTYQDILDLISQFQATQQPVERVFDLQSLNLQFTVWTESGVARTVDFAGHLSAVGPALVELLAQSDSFLKWEDVEAVCCLDVDYHNVEAGDVGLIVPLIYPRPFLWHRSRNGGAHLYYHRTPDFDADHLAAAAAVRWHQIDQSAKFELLARTRTVGKTLEIQTQVAEKGAVLRLFEEPEMGGRVTGELEPGKRYHHRHCPFNPSEDDKRDPVIVFEKGVFCHACNRFRSHAELARAGLARVSVCAAHFTHWEHASLVWHDAFPLLEGKILPTVYETLLTAHHGREDPRIPKVFTAGKNMIRAPGRWVGTNWTTAYSMTYAKALIEELPVAQDLTGNPIAIVVDRFRQNSVDLSEWGYFPVTPVRGLKIYGHQMSYPDPNRVTLVTQTPKFQPSTSESKRPKYRKPSDRMGLETAWQKLESYFPGIHRQLVELLVAGKGVQEAQVGIPPFVLLHGPSGAGKSGTIHVAAGIVADRVTEFEFDGGTDRLRQCLLEAIDRGSYAVVNEVFKSDRSKKLGPRAAIDPVLNFTPDSTSHKLYVGPVSLAHVPVLVLTDTGCPREIVQDTQIGRRIVYVRLSHRVEWERPVAERTGGMDFSDLRFFDSEMPLACDSIISDIIDRHFREPRVFADIARDLGLDTLDRSPEFVDERSGLFELFNAVAAAPDVNASDKKWLGGGDGWKKISRNSEDPLSERWLEVCDGEGEAWSKSRRCEEADWGTVLGIPGRRIDFKIRKRTIGVIFVRFVAGDRVNSDILPSA